MSAYLQFIRLSFLGMLAYRMRYVTGILTYVVSVGVNYYLWLAAFGTGGQVINGFTADDMATYVAVGWIARTFYFSDIDYEIDEIVKSGAIRSYLLRPVSFQLMMYSHALGGALFRAIFFTVPVGIAVALFYPVKMPHDIGSLAMFLVATLFSFIVLAQVNLITGLLAFYLKSIQGVMQVKYYLVQLCSGLLLPISFFPPLGQKILNFMPFRFVADFPLKSYLGNYNLSEFSQLLAIDIFWTIALALIASRMWGRAVAKLTVQGG